MTRGTPTPDKRLHIVYYPVLVRRGSNYLTVSVCQKAIGLEEPLIYKHVDVENEFLGQHHVPAMPRPGALDPGRPQQQLQLRPGCRRRIRRASSQR